MVQLQQGLTALQPTGARIGRPRYLAMLAEVYGQLGQTEEGLSLITQALAAIQETGEGLWQAELYRCKGELVLKSQKSKMEAEECFWQAIEIARRQSAKALELRAMIRLSRLWQQQGNKPEAGQRLAEIYGWFTEGFDTPDLKEAKVLLDELS